MARRSMRLGATLVGGVGAVILLLTAGQSQASTAPRVPTPVPQWGADIQVNPIPTGTPNHPLQMNFSLATSPTHHDQVLAGWDNRQVGSSPAAYGWSTDQGQTWANGRFDG